MTRLFSDMKPTEERPKSDIIQLACRVLYLAAAHVEIDMQEKTVLRTEFSRDLQGNSACFRDAVRDDFVSSIS